MDEGHPIRFRFERNDMPAPSAAEVNAVNAHRSVGFHDYNHDAISRWLLVKNRCQLLGIVMECATCKGHADIATDEERATEEAASEAWKPTDPPAGEGWQLWETVSEGSPISPVFDSAEGLATWLADPDRPKMRPDDEGPRDWMPYDAALKFVNAGWAPSFMATPQTGFVSGAEYVGYHSEANS
jgi:hypothetical protein